MRFRALFLGATALLLACTPSTEAGLSIDLRSEAPANEPAGPPLSDNGAEVRLLGGYVATGSIELAPCPTAMLPRLLDWLSPIREAHAHVASSPTMLGNPIVEALVGERSATFLGTLTPPPGAYCEVRVTIHPADADAADLPSDVDMVGRSLVLWGTYGDPGDTSVPFYLSTSETITVALPLEDFTLGASAPHPTMTFIKPDTSWFAGVDFMAQPEGVQAFQVLKNIGGSLTVRVE